MCGGAILEIVEIIFNYIMTNKFINWFSNKLANQKEKHFGMRLLLSAIFFVPLIAVVSFSLFTTYSQLTKFVLERRGSIATLAATTVNENLTHLTDLGVSFADRIVFRKLISESKWQEAVKLQENVPGDFPIIERIFLTDPSGTLMADFPALPGVVGQNFSSRGWYKGVSRNWQPYVSEVYKRSAKPQYNVVAVAIPIKSNEDSILGILVMQIKPESLFEWTKNIEIGSNGFIYIIDQNNHIVIHPKFSPQDEIIDFSNIEAVQKLRQDQEGIIISFNQIEREERVTAFESIPKYGWGMIVQEPTKSAFADRNREMMTLLIIYIFISLLCFFLHYLFIKLLYITNNYRQKEQILLDSIGDGVAALDRYWNITLWNNTSEKITGWTKEEVLGKPFRNFMKFIRESNRKENVLFIEEAIVYGRTGHMENNTLLIKKDGTEIPVGDSAAPIFDSDGVVSGAIIIFRDIATEKESRSLKSDFAYASHQLNTPVTKALWNLESAMEENDAVKLKEKLAIAYKSTKSIQKLNVQLYSISEIDQKTILPKYENIKLIDLIGEIDKDFKDICKECNVSLNMEPISPILGIKTDPKMLKRILLEITENASFYNKPGGKVDFRTTADENGLLFEIVDSGIGIPAEQETLIFTKFFRGSNFDTTEIIGAGLGLFIAQNYTKLLGGKMWFESKENKGTTFYILLPIK